MLVISHDDKLTWVASPRLHLPFHLPQALEDEDDDGGFSDDDDDEDEDVDASSSSDEEMTASQRLTLCHS